MRAGSLFSAMLLAAIACTGLTAQINEGFDSVADLTPATDGVITGGWIGALRSDGKRVDLTNVDSFSFCIAPAESPTQAPTKAPITELTRSELAVDMNLPTF